ncbi:MAG: hypothetical protein ACREU2_07520, partial [Steroidobacteraceae bacterium]
MSTVCVPRLRGYRGIQPAQISALALVVILSVTIPKAQAGPALPQCPGCMLPTDEIQVYDAAITEVGQWNLTWHQNYTPQAQSVPDFPGG